MANFRRPTPWYAVPHAGVAFSDDVRHASSLRIGVGAVVAQGLEPAARQTRSLDANAYCEKSAHTIKIGRTLDVSGLFRNLVAGTGFEPVTFGL